MKSLVVKECVKFSAFIVIEDVLLSFSAYYMFCMILAVDKQSKNQMPSVTN